MPHRVAQLFTEAEEKVESELARLETATGHQGHDLRLLSQHSQLVRSRIAELGLDPADTTPEELYHALRAKYLQDSASFEVALGLNGANAEDDQQHAMEITRHALANEEVWAIRSSVIKTMLKQLAPIKTLKVMHFRTLDSMLKRANPAVVLAVARMVESVTWQSKWSKMAKKQPASAHEASLIHFVSAQLPKTMPDLKVPEAATVVVNSAGPPDMLGQVLRAVAAAEDMTGKDYSAELGQVHPALRWWNANAHLVAWVGGEAVSLNIYDVAEDHHAAKVFDQRKHEQAASRLMRSLSDEYQKFIDDLNPEQLVPAKLEVSPVMVAAEVENV